MSSAISLFVSKLALLAEFETKDSWEAKTWTFLNEALGSADKFYRRLNVITNVHIYEPICLFSSSLERIRGSQNNAKILVNPDAYSSKEKVEHIKIIAHDWESHQTIKDEILSRHLNSFAQQMQLEVI